jgi:hypothetical protein
MSRASEWHKDRLQSDERYKNLIYRDERGKRAKHDRSAFVEARPNVNNDGELTVQIGTMRSGHSELTESRIVLDPDELVRLALYALRTYGDWEGVGSSDDPRSQVIRQMVQALEIVIGIGDTPQYVLERCMHEIRKLKEHRDRTTPAAGSTMMLITCGDIKCSVEIASEPSPTELADEATKLVARFLSRRP